LSGFYTFFLRDILPLGTKKGKGETEGAREGRGGESEREKKNGASKREGQTGGAHARERGREKERWRAGKRDCEGATTAELAH
jgi:hypothetical protein